MKETLQISRVKLKSHVPQVRALLNNGSVLTFGLPAQNNVWTVRNRFDDIKPEQLVQKSGLRRLQRNDTISAVSLSPPWRSKRTLLTGCLTINRN